MSFITSFSSFFFSLRGILTRIASKTGGEAETLGLLIASLETLFNQWKTGTLPQDATESCCDRIDPPKAAPVRPGNAAVVAPRQRQRTSRKPSTRRASARDHVIRPAARAANPSTAIDVAIPAAKPYPPDPLLPLIFSSA
jgi:hypothetical protein